MPIVRRSVQQSLHPMSVRQDASGSNPGGSATSMRQGTCASCAIGLPSRSTVEAPIETRGPHHRSLRTLKGRAAGRAIRTLVDHTPPFGIRELAERTESSAPTLSRVVDLLDREGLVEREPRGPIKALDWAGSIRRWALDYDLTISNTARMFLDPRGIEHLADNLRDTAGEYAVTGALALPEDLVIAPARLGMVYTRDAAELRRMLDLRTVDTGANVLLFDPFDEWSSPVPPVVAGCQQWRARSSPSICSPAPVDRRRKPKSC
jgi:hypothetical protein